MIFGKLQRHFVINTLGDSKIHHTYNTEPESGAILRKLATLISLSFCNCCHAAGVSAQDVDKNQSGQVAAYNQRQKSIDRRED